MHSKALKTKPTRRLILLDAENLAMSPRLTDMKICALTPQIMRSIAIKPQDLVFVGGDINNAFPCRQLALSTHGSICLGTGPDGADNALIQRAREVPPSAFSLEISPVNELVIGSGDHIFRDIAIEMKDRGVKITVLSHEHCASRALIEVADRVIYFNQRSAHTDALAA